MHIKAERLYGCTRDAQGVDRHSSGARRERVAPTPQAHPTRKGSFVLQSDKRCLDHLAWGGHVVAVYHMAEIVHGLVNIAGVEFHQNSCPNMVEPARIFRGLPQIC